jgi:TPR repeat protein
VTLQSDEFLAGEAIKAGAYDEAVRLLRPLAERHSAYALLTLGWIYETGATGTPEKDAARAYYEGAVAQGSTAAYPYLGWLLLKDGEVADARKAFECGAQLENDECKSVLARLADNANEKLAAQAMEEEHYEEAVRLLRPLAEHDSKFALRCLGFICETGITGPPDRKAARSYYERAASQGRADDYYELGRFLRTVGDESNERAAYQAGAERDHVPSMSKLGRMLVEGRGGPLDIAGGSAWLQKAAAKGHIFAQRTLLAIEEANARSLFEKLRVKAKIAKLAFRGARALAMDPDSDRARWLRAAAGLARSYGG